MKAFGRLIEQEVESHDRIMEWMTVGSIDTKDLRTTGSILKIGEVVFGELLPQVKANHVKLG